LRKKWVTLKDVARKAGVSYQTVSKVLNNKGRVSEETKRRIFQAVEELGYRPNILGRSLRRASISTIGFVTSPPSQKVSDPFFNELLMAIIDAASKFHYDILVSVCQEGTNTLNNLEYLIKTGRVDGIILDGIKVRDERVNYLIKEKVPFVAIGRTDAIGEYAYVDVDGKSAIYKITKHFIEKGHRVLAFVGPSSEYFYVKERLMGFLEAIRESGLSIDERYILLGYDREEGGYRAMDFIMNLKPFPTAIVCCSDLIAIGVMKKAYEYDLDVGKNPAITGFDGISLTEYLHPPLTTARQPVAQIGEYVVKIIVSMLENKTLVETNQILLHAEVIIRKSSDSPFK
jgi:DNA-binding LacI/PurR family transcriptional regulator